LKKQNMNMNRLKSFVFYIIPCSIVAVVMAPAVEAGKPVTVQANCVAEVVLTTQKSYANPFMDVTLDVLVTAPDGRQLRVPAFWAGGNEWRFRYASGTEGMHTYRTECSDRKNPKLQGVEGKIEVVPYQGENPLYLHGPIRVAKDQRHFEHADGTPFFWLGDTWWKGLCKRIPFEGFQELTSDRKAKGFTVVQIIAGTYPDEAPFDPRWENEGGMPYVKDYTHINPAYFEYADQRLKYLMDMGIMPAIVGGWSWHMPMIGVEKMNRHWRYLIARYGAFPVVWIVCGEMRLPEWIDVARYVRKTDPYHRLATIHPPGVPELMSGRKTLSGEQVGDFWIWAKADKSGTAPVRDSASDEALIDFDMLQISHNDWASAPFNVSEITSSYSKTPTQPVVDGEVVYEWLKSEGRHDVQRFMFWTSMLNGAAGHTYGAGGLWQMNSETIRGSGGTWQLDGQTVRGPYYDTLPWFVAMRFPGSAELGLGKKLLEEYQWWHFEPHPEWVDPHSTTLFEPHALWYDNHKKWRDLDGRWDLPYCAGIAGEVRFIYIPGNNFYQLKAPTVKHLEPGTTYHAFFFDPTWGKRFDLGKVVGEVSADLTVTGDYRPPQLPSPQDWILVLERVKP